MVTNEQALTQAGLIDPASAVQPGHLIPVEVWIEGTLSNNFDPPAPLRYEIRIVEEATGIVRTTLRGFLRGDGGFFEDQRALSAELIAALCAPGSRPGAAPARSARRATRGRSRGGYTAEIGGPTPAEDRLGRHRRVHAHERVLLAAVRQRSARAGPVRAL